MTNNWKFKRYAGPREQRVANSLGFFVHDDAFQLIFDVELDNSACLDRTITDCGRCETVSLS